MLIPANLIYNLPLYSLIDKIHKSFHKFKDDISFCVHFRPIRRTGPKSVKPTVFDLRLVDEKQETYAK